MGQKLSKEIIPLFLKASKSSGLFQNFLKKGMD